MSHRIGLAIGLFLLTTGQAAASSPSPGVRMDILVDGRPLPRYAAYGTWYVEALKDKDYEIRLRNPWPVRVAVALSVDGLNTIDARHTTAASARKWVIGPYETITISGWQTSMTAARRFHFTSERKSYAQWLGKTDDIGVVSAVFFRERIPQVVTLTPPSGTPRSEASAGAPPSQSRPAPSAAGESNAAPSAAAKADEYAATGIGRRTEHPVTEIHMDLEDAPAASIDVRYEYRPQLVRLGILPAPPADSDPLARRQKSRGFAPGFCPEPKRERW